MMPLTSYSTVKVSRGRTERTFTEEVCKRKYLYCSFKELSTREKGLRLAERDIEYLDDRVVLRKQEKDCFLPKFKVCIDDSRAYTVKVYNWLIPEDHPLYSVNM